MNRQFLKIDARYNWIIGVAITATISVVGTMLKFMTMLQH